MFILRRFTEEKMEINTFLGEEYVLILKEKNEKEFKDQTETWSENDLKGVYGLILFDCSESIMPLYSLSTYYVMTEEGKTFSNISKKEN